MSLINRYTTTTNGAMTFTGNTLGLSKETNLNAIGTNDSIGAFITLNLASQVDAFPAGTTLNWQQNQSAALLNIPSGSTILYAELIWGGSYLSNSFDVTAFLNNSVSFTTPTGTFSIIPDTVTANTIPPPAGSTNQYERSANVTALVQVAGAGIYSTSAVPAVVDPRDNNGNTAGWTLAVIYSNPSLPARNMSLFVGLQFIQNGNPPVYTTVSGFSTPTAGLVKARVLVSAIEGDANLVGDQMLIGPTIGALATLSGPNNPVNNFFDSQINNDKGNLDTTGTFGNRNQNALAGTNIPGGRQGYDITNVDASANFINSQTSAIVEINTVGDRYSVDALGIQIDVNSPTLKPAKTVDKAFSTVGNVLNYTVVIPNTGLVDANNVIFKDIAPSGTSYVGGSFKVNGVPIAGDTNVGINIGTIAIGVAVTVTFQVTVNMFPNPNPITNLATTDYQYTSVPGGPILNGSSISNSVTTQINVGKLTLAKIVDKAFATIGDTLTYTIAVTNTGNIIATNIVFQDTPPSSTNFVAGSVTVGGVPNVTASPVAGFNIGNIAPQATVTVIFNVTVTSLPIEQEIANISNSTFNYQVDPNDGVLTGTGLSNPALTNIQLAKVDTVKSVDKVVATIGDTLNYTATVINNGTVNVNNVIFTDIAPTGTSFVTGSVSVNGVANVTADPTVGFSMGSISVGNIVTVTFQVMVNSVPSPNTLVNTATETFKYQIDPNGPVLNGISTSNSVTTQVNLGKMTIVKAVDKAFATIGDTLTYTMIVTNTGNVTANNILFSDTPPASTSFVSGSVTVSGVPNISADPTVGFNIGNILPGASATVTFKATVNLLPTPKQVSNIANVIFSYQLTSGGAVVTGTTASNPAFTNIEVSSVNTVKSVDKAFAAIGDILTYTVTIANNGTVNANNVVFVDVAPSGTSFVAGSVIVNGVSKVGADPTLGFNLGIISPAVTVTVIFQVKVNSIPLTNPLVNTASGSFNYKIDPNGTVLNGTSTSNAVPTKINIGQIDIVKNVDKSFATIGDTLIYTNIVTNTGTVVATNVFFNDIPPTGTSFVAGSVIIDGVLNGAANPSIGFNLGSIAVGGSIIVNFKAIVNSLPSSQQIANLATATFNYKIDPNGLALTGTVTSNPSLTNIKVSRINTVKSVDKPFATVGDILTYTTVITNSGTVAANNVVFTDITPIGASFVVGSVTVNALPNISADPNLGFSLGTINVGVSITVIFKVKVNVVPVINPVLNTASETFNYKIDPNGPVLNGTSTSNVVPTKVNVGKIGIVKTVNKAFTTIGDTLTYSTVVTNTGNVIANNVFFTDIPPSNTIFVANSVTIASISKLGFDPVIGFNLGNIAPGASVTVTFQVKVNSQPVPAQIINTASATFRYQIDVTGPIINGSATSNQAISQVNLQQVSNVKNVDKVFATIGDTLIYTSLITNNGSVPVTNVFFTDTTPVGTTFNSGSVIINGSPQALFDPTVGFNVGNITAGNFVTVVFTATVNAVTVPPQLTNTSNVLFYYQIDPNLPPQTDNKTSNSVVTQVSTGLLTVVKSVDKNYATIEDILTYTVIVTNPSTITSTSVFFYDIPPTGTSFVANSVSINGGVPIVGFNPSVGFSIPANTPNDNIPAGGSVIVSFSVKVDTLPNPSQLINAAAVTLQYIPGPGLNPITETIGSNPVVTQVNVGSISVTKVSSNVFATIGDILTYTTTITNTGNVLAANILFKDTIPVAASFIPNTVSINGGLPQPGLDPVVGFNIVTILPGVVVTIVFNVKINTLPTPNQMENTASATFSYTIVPGGTTITNTVTSIPVPTQVNVGKLNMQKTVNNSIATIGDILNYSVAVTNTGNVTATNIIFTDIPPAGTNFIVGSVTVGLISKPGFDPTIGFTIGNLIPAGTITVTFQTLVASLPSPQQITNIADSTFDYKIDPNGVVTPGTSISNPALTDIKISKVDTIKSVDTAFATIGETLTYTALVTNNGTVNANNAIFTDFPPAGTSFVTGSVTIAGVTTLGADPTAGFNLGTISAGQTVAVTFKVTVNAIPTPNPIINAAIVTFKYQIDTNGPVLNGNSTSNTVSTQINSVKVDMKKTVDKFFATIGDILTYSTLMTNTGNAAADNVIFKDIPDANTSFISGSVTIGGVPNLVADPTLGFSLGDIALGGNTVITFKVKVNSQPPLETITNIANSTANYRVDPNGPLISEAIASNPAFSEIEVLKVDTVKSVDKAIATIGDTLTYTVVVANNGTVDINSVIFIDKLTTGISFVPSSVTVGGVPSLTVDPTVGFNLGTIPEGQSVTVMFKAIINAVPTPNPVANIATQTFKYKIDPNGAVLDGTSTSNAVPTQVNVGSLSMIKTVDKDFATIGDTLTYNILVNNTGNVITNNVVFQDTTPPSTSFITGSVTINGILNLAADPLVGFAIGNIPPGGTVTVIFKLNVNVLPSPEQIINVANGAFNYKIDPNGSALSGNSTSNSAVTEVEVSKIDIVKSVDKAAATIGDILTYTVVVTNNGTVNANNTIFIDNPPEGNIFIPGSIAAISFIPGGGTTDPIGDPNADPTIGFSIGTIHVDQSITIIFKVEVVSLPIPSLVNNFATLTFDYKIDPNESILNGTTTSNLAPTQINAANIDILKSVDKGYATIGDILTYTVAATNSGNVTAINVKFLDIPSVGTSFVAGSVTVGGVANPALDPSSGFSIGNIAVGGSTTITFKVIVNMLPKPDLIVNIANTTYSYQPFLGERIITTISNSNPVPTQINVGKLDTVKSADKTKVEVGDGLSYTTVITNTGNVVATNVFFKDIPPVGTVFISQSVEINGASDELADPSLGFSLGTILPSDFVTVIFSVRVIQAPEPPDPSVITNTATVTFNYKIYPNGALLNGNATTNQVLTNIIPSIFKQFSVDENLTIPIAKPDIEDIINTIVEVEIVATKVITTPCATSNEGQILTGFKLVVEGKLKQKIEYVATDPIQSVHVAEFDVPFSTFMILPLDYTKDTAITVIPYVEDVYVQIIDKRTLFKNVTLRIEAKI